ncbi:SLC13 family permease [Spirillospora sp. NPDC029432]|uniref:GntP family permease n=1 Tax=Spirillospora sp. NPDC029432 TaxID=3154599 RepID=UPI003455DC81
MENWPVLIHTGITIAGIVAMVVWARINPVIALVVGALYLGLASGLGFKDTPAAITEGFGALMAEVGLIIGFGVLIGSLLSATGTLQRVVHLLLRLVGAKRSPHALGLASGIVFPSIYFDVALVMLAPIARSIAVRTGRSVAPLAGALAIGLEVALLMVLPGAAALAVAGSLDIALGTMLLWGIPFGAVAIVISIVLHTMLMGRTWNPDKDVDPLADYDEDSGEIVGASGHHDDRPGATGGNGPSLSTGTGTTATATTSQKPLALMLLPVLVPVILIVVNTITEAVGTSTGLVVFLGNPVVALLIGLILAIVLALPTLGRAGVEEVIAHGASASGVILLFTGVAGSLGQVLVEIGVADIVEGLFSANASFPLLLTWAVGALLRLAQGSGSVAAITAAALIAPAMADLGTPAVLIALAAAAGASFGGNVSDNTFWMFKTLLGLTTRGAFQVYTVAQSILSFVALGMVLVAGIFA